MTTTDTKPFAQLAYEAYAASTGGKTWDGKPMPTWAEIVERTPHVAKAWTAAAEAAVKAAAGDLAGAWRLAHPNGLHAEFTPLAFKTMVFDSNGERVDDVVWLDPDTHRVQRNGRASEQVEGWTYGEPNAVRRPI